MKIEFGMAVALCLKSSPATFCCAKHAKCCLAKSSCMTWFQTSHYCRAKVDCNLIS